jgi:hypothetical protein
MIDLRLSADDKMRMVVLSFADWRAGKYTCDLWSGGKDCVYHLFSELQPEGEELMLTVLHV